MPQDVHAIGLSVQPCLDAVTQSYHPAFQLLPRGALNTHRRTLRGPQRLTLGDV